MDIKLEQLFEEYQLSKKERYEFMQIYRLLSPLKKVKALENFAQFVESNEQLKKSLALEQELLFWECLESIEEKLYKIQKNSLELETYEEIQKLKTAFVYK